MTEEKNNRQFIFDLPVIKIYKKGKREINVSKSEFQEYILNYPRQLTLSFDTKDCVETATFTDEAMNIDVAVQYTYLMGSYMWREGGYNQEYVVVENYEELFNVGGDT